MVLTVKDIERTQKELFDHCVLQAKKKGNDYSGKAEDTFMNLRMSKLFGLVDNDPKACMVQIMNKVSRMANFSQPGFVSQVTDESIFDTVSDLQNYSTYWLMLMREMKQNEAKEDIIREFKNKKLPIFTKKDIVKIIDRQSKKQERRGNATK